MVWKTKSHMGIMLYFSILLHNFITWYMYTNTVFSAALYVVEDGDGPCETDTCHVARHEIEVVEPWTTWREELKTVCVHIPSEHMGNLSAWRPMVSDNSHHSLSYLFLL
jgi:hypothetical protein